MHIVVVGARERDEQGDEDLVNSLLTFLHKCFGSALVIISTATDRGVGRYVKDRCLKEKEKFKFIDVSTKIFGELPPARLAQVFKCRNAAIVELGSKFYIFDTAVGKGITDDLVVRAKKVDCPVFLYKPGVTEPVQIAGKKPITAQSETDLVAQARDV
jgi:hypothetical protein